MPFSHLDARHPGTRLLRSVGHTPLVELGFDDLPKGTRLFAKLESTNPGGSIKDRPVARMLAQALAHDRLAGGRRLLDSIIDIRLIVSIVRPKAEEIWR